MFSPDLPSPVDVQVSIPVDELDDRVDVNKVDLNRDNVFDWRDVEIFELLNGLPNTLSTNMRAVARRGRFEADIDNLQQR